MSKYAFGVDVGGTTVKLGLFNDEGQVLDKWEIPTVKDNGGEKVLPDIAASIKNKMQEKSITAADLVGVGIGAPGAVNAEGFMVNGAVNIGWGSFDLAETLKKELDLPVTVKAGNDANVAALGEMWQGGGKGYSNLVAVTLGTGVGGGIIIDGRMLTGGMPHSALESAGPARPHNRPNCQPHTRPHRKTGMCIGQKIWPAP